MADKLFMEWDNLNLSFYILRAYTPNMMHAHFKILEGANRNFLLTSKNGETTTTKRKGQVKLKVSYEIVINHI